MTVEKLFPKMHSCPKKGTCLAIVCYWLPAFILVPQWLPYFSLGMWEDPAYGSWLQIGYHALNAVVMLVFLRDAKEFLAKPAVKIAAIVLVVLILLLLVWKLLFSRRRYRYGRSVGRGRGGSSYRGRRRF